MLAGDVGRAVLGVVVVDVDVGVGQDALEVVHHLADGHGFVVAGYEYCDLVCHWAPFQTSKQQAQKREMYQLPTMHTAHTVQYPSGQQQKRIATSHISLLAFYVE